MASPITYKDAGVDIDEGARAVEGIRAAVKSTYRPEVIGDIGGFGGMFSAAAFKAMEDPILVSGTDGVGTKLALAQKVGRNETVGIDLVAMCVNDILACGAEPLFFLDYVAVGKLDAESMAEIVGGIAEGCRQAGCALIGGEMAEHPGVMAEDDYDLSGFCVGVVDRPLALDPCNVREGDVVLGLASTGVHSNGFSLVRRAVTNGLTKKELLTPVEELGGVSLATALLAPTRIYVKSVHAALAAGVEVHAQARITGGRSTENLNRALPADLNAQVKLGSWESVPIIDYVVRAANLDRHDALKTFNCGIGMCVIVPPTAVEAARAVLEANGEQVFEIGVITPGEGKVTYTA